MAGRKTAAMLGRKTGVAEEICCREISSLLTMPAFLWLKKSRRKKSYEEEGKKMACG